MAGLVIPAEAETDEMPETAAATVSVGSGKVLAGGTITVPISISGNPGFTNFAVSFTFDPEKLILVSIQTGEGEEAYLCGNRVSTNTQWQLTETGSCGFVVAASANTVDGNGCLFTATFQARDNLTQDVVVTPRVHYLRCNGNPAAEVVVQNGTISTIVPGDLTGDGVVEYDDVMMAYRAAKGLDELTEDQILAADQNGDSKIDDTEVDELYGIYTGGQ